MKIYNKGIEQTETMTSVVLFIERENGKYNNADFKVEFYPQEIEGYTDNQIVTKAWLRVKPQAIQLFNRVWECRVDEDAEEGAIPPYEEVDNPIDFEIVELPPPPAPPEPPVPQPSEVDVLKEQLAQLQNTLDGILTDIIPTLMTGGE